MEALKEAIRREGMGIGKSIVKVDSFLNHRIDVALAAQMGKALYEGFKDEKVDCILTVEASGIAVAIMAAQAFGDIPVIFAKRGNHINVGEDVYTAEVYSPTRQTTSPICVSRQYLQEGMRVLIVDDFLASGDAALGLINILRQARCELVGAGVCVEKGFQEGGKMLRESGIKVVALATVDAIQDGRIILHDD